MKKLLLYYILPIFGSYWCGKLLSLILLLCGVSDYLRGAIIGVFASGIAVIWLRFIEKKKKTVPQTEEDIENQVMFTPKASNVFARTNPASSWGNGEHLGSCPAGLSGANKYPAVGPTATSEPPSSLDQIREMFTNTFGHTIHGYSEMDVREKLDEMYQWWNRNHGESGAEYKNRIENTSPPKIR